MNYASIPQRLALTSRAWATVDWDATRPIMDAMIERGVVYCGMHVITQYQVGEGAAELESDPDFAGLFGATERGAFLDFARRLQGTWTPEDLDYARKANDNRMAWMRRFRALGGTLLAGTDMQFGGIMLHRELRNLEAIGLSPLEVITAATGSCARAMRMENKLGTLREGLPADLVILNRDPLDDLGALRDIVAVLRGGKVMWGDGPA